MEVPELSEADAAALLAEMEENEESENSRKSERLGVDDRIQRSHSTPPVSLVIITKDC